MRKSIFILTLLAVLFGVAQFIRPIISNPPVTLEVRVPDSVKAVLRKGCYDCHSNDKA
jgi:Haem-binding domain